MALCQLRVLLQHGGCPCARPVEQVAVCFQIGKAQQGAAALACAEQLAWAAYLQVLAGYFEAVVGLCHGLQAGAGGVADAA